MLALTIVAPDIAKLAIESARLERTDRDGITYLINAKRNGIRTPLSDAYEQEILCRLQASDLIEAISRIQTTNGG